MNEIWKKMRLDEVCDMYQPKTISSKNMIQNGEYPVFGANGIIGSYNKYNHGDPELLITCRGATCGSVNISLPKSWINGNAMVVRPKDESLDREFLTYLFLGGIDISKIITGSAQPQITRQSLNPVEIPIPPLQEQHQIVSILDQAFAAIDQAKANIEKNITNAKELFQSKLNEFFTQQGEGWEEKKLKEIGVVQTGTTPPTKDKSSYGDYIPFVKPPHFNRDGSINSGESMLSKSGLRKGRLFEENSILMVCIGATIGKTGFSEIRVSSNQQINALTPSKEYIPKLLYFALISPFVQNQVMQIGKGAQATLPIINKSKWEKLKIRIPSEKREQARIVDILDKLKAETFAIEKLYVSKVAELEDLKKSILQKAFAGALTHKEMTV